MGCCNKKLDGKPVSRARYWAGTTFLVAVHSGLLGFMTAASVVVPRYRRVLPFYRAYSRETLRGILARDRIRLVGECERNAECELRP